MEVESFRYKKWNLVQQSLIDVSLEEFVRRFVDDQAVFGMATFLNIVGYHDIEETQWKFNQKNIKFSIPKLNIVMDTKTHCTLTLRISRQTENKLILEYDLASQYPFICQNVWILRCHSKLSNRIIIKHLIRMKFQRDVPFKSIIEQSFMSIA